MGAGSILNPYNLRPPYSPTPLVDTTTGAGTQGPSGFDTYLRNLTTIIAGLAGYNTKYYGTSGNGKTDDQPAAQTALNDLVNAGGGTLVLPVGTFLFESPLLLPAGETSITITGQGNLSEILSGADMPPGQGVIDVSGSNVTLLNFLIEGAVVTSVGLQYGVGFNTALTNNDPMAPSLTTNSSIWVHGPVSNFTMMGVQVQHTGGYATLIDCMPGTINNVNIRWCRYLNNRPFTFGVAAGQLIYGSWPSGIYVNGDGRTAGSGVLNGMTVAFNSFQRSTGNQIWSHVFGFNELHTNFQWISNSFLDIGLDAMEPGGVSGGIVALNVGRRIGYVCATDTGASVPLWCPGANATALDSSGLVKGVPYVCNSFTSVNGGMIDLDGHADSVISSNLCRIPYAGEPEFLEDSIAITGQTNTGSTSYGINANNSSNTAWGGQNVTISANQLINLAAGAIRMYASRNFTVTGNNIEAPSNSVVAPISMGPTGPGPYQRCYGNKITVNKFDYNTTTGTPPCVVEDSTYAAFTSGEINTVCNNVPITPAGTTAIEFLKAGGSGSTVFSMQIWFP